MSSYLLYMYVERLKRVSGHLSYLAHLKHKYAITKSYKKHIRTFRYISVNK